MHTWTGAGRGLRNAVQHLRLVTLVGKPFRFVFFGSQHYSPIGVVEVGTEGYQTSSIFLKS